MHPPEPVSASASQPTFPWKVLPRWKSGYFKSSDVGRWKVFSLPSGSLETI